MNQIFVHTFLYYFKEQKNLSIYNVHLSLIPIARDVMALNARLFLTFCSSFV